LLFELKCRLRVDVEQRQAMELTIRAAEERTRGEQVTGS